MAALACICTHGQQRTALAVKLPHLCLCAEGWPEELVDILPAAFEFLQQHGLINFGVCKAPEAVTAPGQYHSLKFRGKRS